MRAFFSVIAAEIVVGTMAIIACLSFLLILFQNILPNFDGELIHWVYTFRSEQLSAIMKIITFFGGEIFVTSGVIILFLALLQKHKISASNFAFVLVFGIMLNFLLKAVFQRIRPDFMPLIHESTYSFPSGHAMNSFVFYTCVTYFIVRNIKNNTIRILTGILFGGFVLLIGFSRVYLGAHYPSDVIAGYIAGILWFVLVVLVEKTARYFKFFKTS